jgi:hypothetical protein
MKTARLILLCVFATIAAFCVLLAYDILHAMFTATS